MDVIALAAKEGMRLHLDRDQRVARRPATDAGAALAGKPEDLTILDACGNDEIERAPRPELEPTGGPVHRIQEIDTERITMIPALSTISPPLSPVTPAEHRKEIIDIVGSELLGGAVFGTRRAFGETAIAGIGMLRPFRAACIDLAAIEARSLFLIRQQVISRRHLFEFLFRRLVAGVEIGVMTLGQLAIGALHLLGTGRGLQAQYIIRVSLRHGLQT